MKNDIPNIRFWTFYHGSPVKITLKPGQSLCLSECGAHEEGYSEAHDFYTHAGEYVTNEWYNGGSDCDGRHHESGVSQCRIDKLNSEPASEDFPYFARSTWEKAEETTCYDQFAQLSNY